MKKPSRWPGWSGWLQRSTTRNASPSLLSMDRQVSSAQMDFRILHGCAFASQTRAMRMRTSRVREDDARTFLTGSHSDNLSAETERPIDRFPSCRDERVVGSAERLAPEEALVRRLRRRVCRTDGCVPGSVDMLAPSPSVSSPQAEHDAIGLPADRPDDRIGQLLPTPASVRRRRTCAHCQRRVEQQHAAAGPLLEVSVFGDRHAQVLVKLLMDVLE